MRRSASLIVIIALLSLLLAYVATGHFGMAVAQKARAPYQLLVTTEVAARQTLRDTVEALGSTAANESVQVSATVTAIVRSVNFEDGVAACWSSWTVTRRVPMSRRHASTLPRKSASCDT